MLTNIGLNIDDMRGQGYDNGSNMEGKSIGVQKIILDINPQAGFVPCACHSPNLVLNDAAKASGEVFDFFSTVLEVYNLFLRSINRWAILQKHTPTAKGIHVKSLSETRWSSRENATNCLVENLPQIVDALYECADIAEESGTSTDLVSAHQMRSLAHKSSSYKFALAAVIWQDVLASINKVSKYLQSATMELSKAVAQTAFRAFA